MIVSVVNANHRAIEPRIMGIMVERQLRAAMARALERWPKLEVSLEAYAQFVQRATARADEPELDALALEDMALAAGCLHRDPQALRYFEQGVLLAVDPAITRIDSRPEFADEVRQSLRQRLLAESNAKIAEYQGRGSLLKWVRVAAVRTALNLRAQEQRRLDRTCGGDPEASPLADPLDLETEAFKAEYRPALATAVRQACLGLGERDRAILRLHTLDGYSIDKLSVTFGVHRATAARWIHRAQNQLRQAVRSELKRVAQVHTADASMIERMLRSELTTSFSGLESEMLSTEEIPD